MSSVSALKSKFDGSNHGGYSHNTAVPTGAQSLSEQYSKEKVLKSPIKNSNDGAPPSSPLGKKGEIHSPNKQRGGTMEGNDVEGEVFVNAETTLSMLAKSAPLLGATVDDDDDGSLEAKKAPDPSGAVSPRSKKSGVTPRGTPRKTVRKTAIKASELGIDLSDVSSEALNAAVNKWRAEQTGKSFKPDPVGMTAGAKRRQSAGRTSVDASSSRGSHAGVERPKSRSKSRGREAGEDATKNRARSKSRCADSRARSKSRSRSQKSDVRGDGCQDSVKTPNSVVKRKIIVRRRASLDTPEIGGPTPGSEDVKFPNLQQENMTKVSDTAEMCVEAVLDHVSPKRLQCRTDATSSPEMCVESVLGQMPSSPKRIQRRTEATCSVSPDVQQQPVSRGHVMSEARNEVHEIQKRLKEAGISDEQYRAMIAVGLLISLS
eukprot:scaffold4484_cov170-Amphora_coffeaeformis.AAC.12